MFFGKDAVSIPQNAFNGFIIDNPVTDKDVPMGGFGVTDNDFFNTGIDDQPFAQRTGSSVFNIFAGYGILAYQEQHRPDHILPSGMDNGVHFGMHGAAELIAFSPGNIQVLADAKAHVDAVFSSSGSTYIAC